MMLRSVCSLLMFLSGLLFVPACMAQSLQALTEEEMGSVTGQEGILISLDYYYNSEKTDDPATNGQALPGFCATPGTAGSLANMNCRLAIQIANHEDHWVVVKNGHASISVKRLSLDAAFLGDASSAASSEVNLAKFQDSSGTCLIGAGNCGSDAAAMTIIQEMPALRAHYPETGGTYDSGNRVSVGYDDVKFGLYFEGMAVELNTIANVQDGWSLDNNGSFLGLNIADNNGPQAGIAFGGDFYLYGF